jgi:hypothetical protein
MSAYTKIILIPINPVNPVKLTLGPRLATSFVGFTGLDIDDSQSRELTLFSYRFRV